MLAPAAAADPRSAVLAVVDAMIARCNADSAPGVDAHFASPSIVVDDFEPFLWSAPHAARRWWADVDRALAAGHVAHLHLVRGVPTSFTIDAHGDESYLVIPLNLTYTVRGKPASERGLWVLTLRLLGGTWKIVSAAYGQRP